MGNPPGRKKSKRKPFTHSKKKVPRMKQSAVRRTALSTGLPLSVANMDEEKSKKSDATDCPTKVNDKGSHELVDFASNSFLESNESCKLHTEKCFPHSCADIPSCSGPNPEPSCVHIESSVADNQAGFKSDLQGLDSSEKSEMASLPCTTMVISMKDLTDHSETVLSESGKTLLDNQTGSSAKIDENEPSFIREKSCLGMSPHGSLIQVAHSPNSVPLQENESLADTSNMNAAFGANAESGHLLAAGDGKTYSPVEHNILTEKCTETATKKENRESAFDLNEEAGICDFSAKFDKCEANITSPEELTDSSRLELCLGKTSSVKSLPLLSVRKSKLKAHSALVSYRRRTRSSVHNTADVYDQGDKKFTACFEVEKTPPAKAVHKKSVQKNYGCVTGKNPLKTTANCDPQMCMSDKQKSHMCYQAQSQYDLQNTHDNLVNDLNFSDKRKITVKAVSGRKTNNIRKLNKAKLINFVPEVLSHCTCVAAVKMGNCLRCKSSATPTMCCLAEKDHNNGDEEEQEVVDKKRKLEIVVQQKEDELKEFEKYPVSFKEVEELQNALELERKNSAFIKEDTNATIAALNEYILILKQSLHRSEQSFKDYKDLHFRKLTEKDEYWQQKLENVIKESETLRGNVGKLLYGRFLLQKELEISSINSDNCDFNVEVEAIESLRNELLKEKSDNESLKDALQAERENIVVLQQNLEFSKENIEHLEKKLEEMNTRESNEKTGDKSCCKRTIAEVNKEVVFLKKYLSKMEKGKSLLRQELGLETEQIDPADFGEEIKCIALTFEKFKADEQNMEITRNDLAQEKNKTQSLEQKLLQDVKIKADLCDAVVQTPDLSLTEPCTHIQNITQLENALDYQLSVSKAYRETLASKEQEKKAFINSLKEEYGDTVDDYNKFLSSLVWVSDRSRKRLKKLESIMYQQHQ